jgi:two-component system chemotaxis response regulator CheB
MDVPSGAEAGVVPASGIDPAGVGAEPDGARRDIVAIGTSAGGVAALKQLVAALPADYRGALFVVMHISPEAHSELPSILSRAGALPAVHASDGMPIQHGRIHVAPPDYHLLLERGLVRVVQGPRENRHRPAIDPLFRSAAWAYGPRAVGVILTGYLDDGTAGLWAIKSCGGTTVVQEPTEAHHPDMPMNALMHNRIDHRLPLEGIAALLTQLALQTPDPFDGPDPPPTLEAEVESAKLHASLSRGRGGALGALSPFTCPACRGALWELQEGEHMRYRCHVGHAYSQASLMLDQGLAVEESLYTALRAIEEKSTALRRLAERWPDRIPDVKQDYQQRAGELDKSADVLRRMLAGQKG